MHAFDFLHSFCGGFFSTTYRVAALISDVMSAALFVLLLMYAVTVAVTLIAVETDSLLDLTFFAAFGGFLHILAQMGVYCKLSENVTSDLDETGDAFYETHWYSLKIKFQKYYVLPIQQSHKEFRITGLGIVECSLRALTSVSQTHLNYNILQIGIISSNFHHSLSQIIRSASSYFLLMYNLK